MLLLVSWSLPVQVWNCYRSVALDTDEAADEFLMKKSLAANGELEEEEIKEQPNEAEVVEEEEEVVYSTSTEE